MSEISGKFVHLGKGHGNSQTPNIRIINLENYTN